jgi:choline/glycine/proline betaine transport protein
LLYGGGLVALQTAAITTGLPFSVILLGMCVSLHKGLAEYKEWQSFELSFEGAKTRELKPRAAKKLPTFGRKRLW